MTKISRIYASVAIVGCMIVIAACGQAGGPGGVAGTLQRLEPLAAECDGPVTGYVEIDGSVSGRGDETLTAERLGALGHLADRVAACGGVLRVVLFGRSVSEEARLGEAEFAKSSGTEAARLIAAQKLEEGLRVEVEESLPRALEEVRPDGTDLVSTFESAEDFARQRPGGALYVQIDSDDISTVEPVKMNTAKFTPGAARDAAGSLSLPDLSGAHMEFLGVGRSSGARRPSTEKVRALTVFDETACRRMHATSCDASSDYVTGG